MGSSGISVRQVDILEQSEEYVRVAKEELGDKTQGLYLVQGLQVNIALYILHM